MGADNQDRCIRVLAKYPPPGGDRRGVVHIKGTHQPRIMELNRVVNEIARNHCRFAFGLNDDRTVSRGVARRINEPHAFTHLRRPVDGFRQTSIKHGLYRVLEYASLHLREIFFRVRINVAVKREFFRYDALGNVGAHLPLTSRVFQPT